jgi:hypothetical protein
MLMLYSGYIEIEGSGEETSYEFSAEPGLSALDQLDYLISTGLLQIIDNPPEEDEDE